MSRWGKVECSQLLKFADGFDRLAKKDRDDVFIKMIHASANRFSQVASDRTPVDTGYLKGAWSISKVYKQGDSYIAEIVNVAPYATFVNYGHRTTNGGFVQGRHFLQYAISDLERVSQSLLDEITMRKFKELGIG